MANSTFDAVRRAGASLFALALIRAEFASLELTLAVRNALRWLACVLVACVLGMLALIAASAAIVAALWDRLGWYTVGLLALVYGAATIAFGVRLAQALARARPLLSQTFAELAKDRAALGAFEAADTGMHDGGAA